MLVELRETPRQAALKAPATRDATSPRVAGARPYAAAQSKKRARGTRTGSKASGRSGQDAPAWSSEWLAGEGIERGVGEDGPAKSLLPDAVRDALRGAGGPESGDPNAPEPEAVERERVEHRVAGYVADIKAIDRAKNMPDPYWSKVREGLEEGFDVAWDVLDRGPAGSAIVSPRWLREVARDYVAKAGEYGKTGNAYGKGPDVPGAHRSLQDDARDLRTGAIDLAPGTREMLGTARGEHSLFQHRLVTLVMITQGEDGAIEAAVVVDGSGNREYDRLTLEQAAGLADEADSKLGPPPAQGRRTLWAFDTNFILIPPAPVIGCSFDAYFVPQECFWPMKKIVRPRVKLEAVY